MEYGYFGNVGYFKFKVECVIRYTGRGSRNYAKNFCLKSSDAIRVRYNLILKLALLRFVLFFVFHLCFVSCVFIQHPCSLLISHQLIKIYVIFTVTTPVIYFNTKFCKKSTWFKNYKSTIPMTSLNVCCNSFGKVYWI